MYDLNAYLADSLDYVLTAANGINSSGQIIATGKHNQTGAVRAFFLDVAPVIDAVDDPYEMSQVDVLVDNVLDNDLGKLTVSGVDLTETQGVVGWQASGGFTFDPGTEFSPDLLEITSVGLAAGIPWDPPAFNEITPGELHVSAYGTESLQTGPVDVLVLTAAVPQDAEYGAVHALLTSLVLTDFDDATIPSIADPGVHKVAFLGDASGNRDYGAMDASLIARLAVQLDSGFDAYDLTDPMIIADTSENGELLGIDAAYVARKSIGLSAPKIPDLPETTPLPGSGPDPVVTIETGLTVDAGGSLAVPVTIDDGEGLQAFEFSIDYDSAQITVDDAADVAAGVLLASVPGGWSVSLRSSYPRASLKTRWRRSSSTVCSSKSIAASVLSSSSAPPSEVSIPLEIGHDSPPPTDARHRSPTTEVDEYGTEDVARCDARRPERAVSGDRSGKTPPAI